MPSTTTFTLFSALTLLAKLATAEPVQSLTNGGQCLTVAGTPANGSPVTLAACSGDNDEEDSATGQQWLIGDGNNVPVQLYGTNYCLDAQVNPETNRQMVIYPCIASAAQTWYLTPDDRVAITGGTQCLANGGTNAVTTPCATGVTAQAWGHEVLFDTDTLTTSATAVSTGAAVGGGAIPVITSTVATNTVVNTVTTNTVTSVAAAVTASSSTGIPVVVVPGASITSATSSAAATTSGIPVVVVPGASITSATTSGVAVVVTSSASGDNDDDEDNNSSTVAVVAGASSAASSVVNTVTSVVTSRAASATSAVGSAPPAVATAPATGAGIMDSKVEKFYLAVVALGAVAGGMMVL